MERKSFDANFHGMLDGVRVVDLARVVAGNMLTLQLADHGADVIKVEPTPSGDPLRSWRDNGYSTYWKVYCRNKRSRIQSQGPIRVTFPAIPSSNTQLVDGILS